MDEKNLDTKGKNNKVKEGKDNQEERERRKVIGIT